MLPFLRFQSFHPALRSLCYFPYISLIILNDLNGVFTKLINCLISRLLLLHMGKLRLHQVIHSYLLLKVERISSVLSDLQVISCINDMTHLRWGFRPSRINFINNLFLLRSEKVALAHTAAQSSRFVPVQVPWRCCTRWHWLNFKLLIWILFRVNIKFWWWFHD